MKAVTPDRMLTVGQAAEMLSVCKTTVYRLVYAEQLAAVPIGFGKKRPHIRIAESNVREFMTHGTGKAVAA